MSIISTIVEDALKGVNWLSEAENAVTTKESLLPLLVKTAIDGFNAARGGGSLLTVITDIERDIEAYTGRLTANVRPPTTDQTASASGTVTTDQPIS